MYSNLNLENERVKDRKCYVYLSGPRWTSSVYFWIVLSKFPGFLFLYGWVIFCCVCVYVFSLSSHQMMFILISSTFQLLLLELQWTWMWKPLWSSVCSPLGVCLGVVQLGHTLSLISSFSETSRLISTLVLLVDTTPENNTS